MPEKATLRKQTEPQVEPLVSPVDIDSPTMRSNDAMAMNLTTHKTSGVLAALILLVAVIGGVGTGYFFSMRVAVKPSTASRTTSAPADASKVEAGKVYGSKDDSAYKDSAEGVLVTGGVNGEGSHHIVREGGESQNVYLTSSVVDLNTFVGHKVLIKGETFKAQRAGWLMDVGQVKVIELNAALPAWAQKVLGEQQEASDGAE